MIGLSSTEVVTDTSGTVIVIAASIVTEATANLMASGSQAKV